MPGADWDELPKMIQLVEHFHQHEQKSNGRLTFYEFVVLHYVDSIHAHQEDHSQLPFQHFCSGASPALIPYFSVEFNFPEPQQSLFSSAQLLDPRESVPAVFQPPRRV
jgi:hypothetical protein